MKRIAICVSLLFAAPALAEAPSTAKTSRAAAMKTAEARPGPLPVPSLDGKAISVASGQRVFHLPMRFARVEKFYRELFGADRRIAIAMERGEDLKGMTITSKREGDAWAKATVREGAVDTTVEVTPIVRLDGDTVLGNAKPLVQFVLPRNPGVVDQVNSISHMPDGPR